MSTLDKKIERLLCRLAENHTGFTSGDAGEMHGLLQEVRELQNFKSALDQYEAENENLILSTDAYKLSHFLQYPPGTEYVYSYIESRGGKYDKIQFSGIRAFKKKYLSKPITQAMIDYAETVAADMGIPFNREGWEYILHEHGGRLPIKIKTVREGTLLAPKNVLATVVNTDPKCFWLSSYIETILLRAIWYSTTVGTLSFNSKVHILAALNKSSDNPMAHLAFALNDFGARGVSSGESAELGGMAHLMNFAGTDNIEAVLAIRRIYGEKVLAGSVSAMEHSTVTSWGKLGEADAYSNMIVKCLKPGGIVAIVSDSYDIWNAIDSIFGKTLKDKIMNSGGTVVVRPDSGDALTVPIKVVERLAAIFGYTVNSKGYKVLPVYIKVIQGDGITETSLPIILKNLLDAGFSAENLVFGMGGGLLQMVNRDDLKFAQKTSAVSINGVWHDVFKQPIDSPDKMSKRGRFVLYKDENFVYYTVGITEGTNLRKTTAYVDEQDQLETQYEDGISYNDIPFVEIREMSDEAAIRLAG